MSLDYSCDKNHNTTLAYSLSTRSTIALALSRLSQITSHARTLNQRQSSTRATTTMTQPTLTLATGPRAIGATGLGLMGMTWRPPHLLPSTSTAHTAMSTALSLGATFWNGGEIYGTPSRNSTHLLAEYFAQHPADAAKVVLSIKGGFAPGSMNADCSETNLRRSVDDSLANLKGKSIDIFECARIDPKVSIEDTIAVLAALVAEGKIGAIGLSEVRASTIARAAAIHPIAAVEVELSLWSTDILRNGVVHTCAQLGIPIIAYAPLSRGALAGDTVRKNADIPDGDMRKRLPRFQDDVLQYNNRLVDEIEAFASKRHITKAQVAIAWVRGLSGRTMKVWDAQGKESEVKLGTIVPIPGATTEARVRENYADVELTEAEVGELTSLAMEMGVRGDRYSEQGMKQAEG